jgi:hypothetical protein
VSKYRKRPVVVEVTQWFKPGDHPAVQAAPQGMGWCPTLEGGHVVTPGDWIITGIKGEHYPCKPDIFAATYEPAEKAPELVVWRCKICGGIVDLTNPEKPEVFGTAGRSSALPSASPDVCSVCAGTGKPISGFTSAECQAEIDRVCREGQERYDTLFEIHRKHGIEDAAARQRLGEQIIQFRTLLEEAVTGFSRVLVATSDQSAVYDWTKRVKAAIEREEGA